MKILFLGTGTSQGIPVIACDCLVCESDNSKDKRLRTSILFETEGKVIVIDSGPDFRQQMLRENIKKLDAILFTHQHKDHIAGLDDVRAFNYIQQKPMEVYADQRVLRAVKNEFAYSFAEDKYPGVPDINLHLIENQPFLIDNVQIIPIQVMHLKLPIFGFRIHDFVYITDANFISEAEKDKMRNAKILVINALRKKSHISHFTLEQALQLIEEVKPEKAFLTHLSHQMGKHDEISCELPDNVQIAFDGLSVEW